MRIWNLYVQTQEARPPQIDQPHLSAFPFSLFIPPLDPFLHIPDSSFDSSPAKVVPQEARRDAHQSIEPTCPSVRLKRMLQHWIQRLNHSSELRLGHPQVQDLRVEVLKSWIQVSCHQPISLYANDTSSRVGRRRNSNMRIQMRKTRMRRSPRKLILQLRIVAVCTGRIIDIRNALPSWTRGQKTGMQTRGSEGVAAGLLVEGASAGFAVYG